MKIVLAKAFRENERMLMRRCGYFEIFNRRTGEVSYIRQLRRTPFPRLHLYIQNFSPNGITANLHLDAKKPVYEGVRAHAGEYDSPVVVEEAERLKSILNQL
ncbi:MAG: hypothetical protein PHH01_01975 [Patescibacteria group bacterium]|nr:hypothetical protein [Patescibacteria group bacterium]